MQKSFEKQRKNHLFQKDIFVDWASQAELKFIRKNYIAVANPVLTLRYPGEY